MENNDKKVLSKSIFILVGLVAFFVILILVAGNGSKNGDSVSSADGKQVIVNVGGQHLIASVADSFETRKKGLAGTHYLNDQSGMFFVFEEAGQHGFWMENTLIDLDIIWLNSSYQVVYMEKNLKPETYPKVFTPPVAAKYVLEVPAGFTDRHKVKLGDVFVVTDIVK